MRISDWSSDVCSSDLGVTRRLNHFEDPSLQIWFVIAAFGAFLILIGIVAFLIQLYVSFRDREALCDATGDPWNGRTLEWSTASPAPAYNFAFTPRVQDQRSEEHTSELQSLMRISYAVFCLKKKKEQD